MSYSKEEDFHFFFIEEEIMLLHYRIQTITFSSIYTLKGLKRPISDTGYGH